MSIRKISVLCACVATLAVSSSAMSQDTTRTRDSLARLQMQPPAHMMTAQHRDSLIAQLLDSANRATTTIAQQLRDSVTTLRSLTLTTDAMSMRMQADSSLMQMTPQQRAQQQNMQQNMQQSTQTTQQTDQQRQATSDQRLRVQKDRTNNNDPSNR